jgi:hypothetical protein
LEAKLAGCDPIIAVDHGGKLPIDRPVRHYPHTAINDAVADMLAGPTIKFAGTP